MNFSVIYCSSCGTANQPQATYCFSCGKVIQKTVPAPTLHAGEAGNDSGTGRLAPRQKLHERYNIIGLLGQGGMGAVYKAEDTQFGNRPVAVKEMSQSNLPPQEAAETAEQFKQEALLLANLNHPNLPSIYDHFTERRRWYLVMDFVEGVTLERYVSSSPGNVLPMDTVLNIGIQLAKVLGYLHTRPIPIIFRDLKPLNVMITPDENIYLIDFGIARLFKQGQARDTVAYVSAGYAAPEQFGDAQTTPQSDIYSLGVMLHRLLSGSSPRSNVPLFNFKPLQLYNPTIPPALAALVAQMLNVNPAQRPVSMAVVRQELERIQRAQQSQFLAPPPPAPPPMFYHADATLPSSPSMPPVAPLPAKRPSLLVPTISIITAIVLVGAIILGIMMFSSHSTPGSSNGSTLSTTGSMTGNVPVATATTAQSTTASNPTPTDTPVATATAVTYPSYSEGQSDIKYYYENESDFAGKNVIQSFDSLTYQPMTGSATQPQFIACAQYQFASVSSPNTTADTARHTFTFQYSSNAGWKVVDMGNWNSC